MYFLTSLILTIISAILWLIFKNKNKLHLEILTLTFGAATLMWFIDCIFSLKEDGVFISFNDSKGIIISVFTFIAGMVFWLFMILILNKRKTEI